MLLRVDAATGGQSKGEILSKTGSGQPLQKLTDLGAQSPRDAMKDAGVLWAGQSCLINRRLSIAWDKWE